MKTEEAFDEYYSAFEGNSYLSLAECLEEIRSFFEEMIDNFITSNNTWKI